MARIGQFRRDTLDNWTLANPVIKDGEFILVATNIANPTKYNKIKIGNGVSTFTQLPYTFDVDNLEVNDLTVTGDVVGVLKHIKSSVYTYYSDEELLQLPDGIYNYWHGFILLQSHYNNTTGIKDGSYQFDFYSGGITYRRVSIAISPEPQTYPEWNTFQSDLEKQSVFKNIKTDSYTSYTDEELLNLSDGMYNTWHGFYILQSQFDSVSGDRTGNYQYRYSSSGMMYRRVDISTPQVYPEWRTFSSDFNNNLTNLGFTTDEFQYFQLPEYSNNTTASAVLPKGYLYRTGDSVKIVH